MRTTEAKPRVIWERPLASSADLENIHQSVAGILTHWGESHPAQAQAIPTLLTRFWNGPEAAAQLTPPPETAPVSQAPAKAEHPASKQFRYGAIDEKTWILWRQSEKQETLSQRKDKPGQPPVTFASEEKLLDHLHHDYAWSIAATKAEPSPAIRQQWQKASQQAHEAFQMNPPIASTAETRLTEKKPLNTKVEAVYFAQMPDGQYAAWAQRAQESLTPEEALVKTPEINAAWINKKTDKSILTAPNPDVMKESLEPFCRNFHVPVPTMPTKNPPAPLLAKYEQAHPKVHLATMNDGWTVAWTEKDLEHPEFIRDNTHPDHPIKVWAHMSNAVKQLQAEGYPWQTFDDPGVAVINQFKAPNALPATQKQDTLHYVQTPKGIKLWTEPDPIPVNYQPPESMRTHPVWVNTPPGKTLAELQDTLHHTKTGLILTEQQPPNALTMQNIAQQRGSLKPSAPAGAALVKENV